MYSLATKIERLPGVGPSLKKTLNALGLFYIEDLFYHLPFRYIDFSKTTTIGEAKVDQMVTLSGQVTSINARRSFRSRLQFTEAILEDNTGEIRVMWFNQPYLIKQIQVGDQLIVAGRIEWYKQKQLTNPFFEKSDSEVVTSGKILPIYHLTKGLSNLRLAKFIKLAWDNTEFNQTDYLPETLLTSNDLPTIEDALKTLHFPSDTKAITKARARIALDDCLPQQVAAALKQRAAAGTKAPQIKTDVEYIKSILKDLPFELTAGQKRVTWDILQSFETGRPQSRLLEGDVGSGKTIIALLAALMTSRAGMQTLLIAPTEILAKQHFETFLKYSGPACIALLTRNFCIINNKVSTRQEFQQQLASGEISIVIGTHALLSNTLDVHKLGLIIIDEQHRFGVGQRAFLQKQHGTELMPHLLSMSATPIPRSLALALFGDLQISQLNQIPGNRPKITTQLLPEENRDIAYKKISNEIAAGRQVFVITPKVEASATEVKSVKDEFSRLQKLFPKFKLGLVYGSMKSEDKDKVMSDFAKGDLDILVATTVIEIGIDMPNATVMLIEGAENFGLAQLHQLRGRVGRGQYPSFCYLFTTEENQLDTQRLKIFEQNSDGFALAEYDLQQRGFGDLFGKQQSGFNFRFPEFITIAALKQARDIALQILDKNPDLSDYLELKELANKYLEEIHTE